MLLERTTPLTHRVVVSVGSGLPRATQTQPSSVMSKPGSISATRKFVHTAFAPFTGPAPEPWQIWAWADVPTRINKDDTKTGRMRFMVPPTPWRDFDGSGHTRGFRSSQGKNAR